MTTLVRSAGGLPYAALRIIGFVSFFDRFCMAPMLVVLSTSLGISLEYAIQLATIYAIFYGAGQPLWGVISDRLGRIAVLRIALIGALAGCLASMLIPGFIALAISRGFTGLMIGALYPMLLTVLGDSLSGDERYRELSNLQTVSALGTTVATVMAGAIASFFDWRAVFAITLVAAVIALVPVLRATNRVPEHGQRKVLAAFGPWPLWVYLIGFLEGLVLLGILQYVVPAMENGGIPVAVAGLLAALYGVGIIIGSQVVQVVARTLGRPTILLIGGGFLIAAYLIPGLGASVPWLAVSSLFIGLANSFMHSTIQGWMTAISPTARATTVSLFATSLFIGSGVATGITADLAGAGGYTPIFAASAAVSVVLVVAVYVSFRRWLRDHDLG